MPYVVFAVVRACLQLCLPFAVVWACCVGVALQPKKWSPTAINARISDHTDCIPCFLPFPTLSQSDFSCGAHARDFMYSNRVNLMGWSYRVAPPELHESAVNLMLTIKILWVKLVDVVILKRISFHGDSRMLPVSQGNGTDTQTYDRPSI